MSSDFFNFSQLMLRLFVGFVCLLLALKRCVCITTTGARLCAASILGRAAPEGLNAASLKTFPKNNRCLLFWYSVQALLLEESRVVCMTCAPSRVKVFEMGGAV